MFHLGNVSKESIYGSALQEGGMGRPPTKLNLMRKIK